MGLFTKKEEKNILPELPNPSELPKLPELPEEKSPSLPTLPKSGLEAIKSSIAEPENRIRSVEIISVPSIPKNLRKEKGPIYIKIEKFKEASETFEDIKSKIADIDSSFRKLKEVKDKEAQEINSWEEELQAIKTHIDMIDSSLFNRIED